MQIKTVDCKTLKMWLKSKSVVLIDVREIVENNLARIKDSNLIPLAQIDIDLIPKLEDKNLVIHCKSGKRSFVACEKLLSQNPDLKIYNLEGGIDAWQNEGFEVLGNKNCGLSIERQVQIMVGGAVFLATLFGLFFSKLFFIIPLFFGAGMFFSGYTGWCGLGILLSKLPFNQKS